jgi:hypothetical protein
MPIILPLSLSEGRFYFMLELEHQITLPPNFSAVLHPADHE